MLSRASKILQQSNYPILFITQTPQSRIALDAQQATNTLTARTASGAAPMIVVDV